MKCVNCQVDIDPKFHHAINNNICPCCSKNIMDDVAFSFLSELKEAILSMATDDVDSLVQGISGWLLSNYQMRKLTHDIKTTKFHSVKKDSVEGAPLDKFMELKKQSEAARIVAEINDEIDGEGISEEDLGVENMDPEDIAYTEKALQVMENSPYNKTSSINTDRIERLKNIKPGKFSIRRSE